MIRISSSHLHTAAVTHPGMGGRQNEDRFSISSYHLAAGNPTPSVFTIVADGIGGHRSGEVASEMAVETISHMVAQSNGRSPLGILDQAIQVTSDAIAARSRQDDRNQGMGATCACAWVIANRLYIASVGDTRVYLLRQGSLQRLTTDHTWIQEAVEKGILSRKDVTHHPNMHVIRRYLGSPKTPQVDVRLRLATDESDTQARSNQGLPLLAGDLLLLCTDGLTDMLSDEEIEPAIRGLELQEAAQKLVDLACERGGKDNVTVVMLLVPPGAVPKSRLSPSWKWPLVILAGLLLAALLITLGTWIVFTYILPPA